ILWPTWPDLPMPLTTTRPLAARIISIAATNGWPSPFCMALASAAIPPEPASSVRSAESIRNRLGLLELASTEPPLRTHDPPRAARARVRQIPHTGPAGDRLARPVNHSLTILILFPLTNVFRPAGLEEIDRAAPLSCAEPRGDRRGHVR